MKISRPSPALVVASVALTVALGGTATAASVLITSSSQVKAGSLDGSDIKNNSLTGLDIKNGSIKAADLSAGLRGAQLKGSSVTGTGLTAREAVRRSGPEAQVADVPARVASLKDVQPGTYLLTAKTTITADRNEFGLGELVRDIKTGSAECVLELAGDKDFARQAVITPSSIAPATLNMQLTRTIDQPSEATITCSVNDFVWRASDTSIVALKLTSSTREDTTG